RLSQTQPGGEQIAIGVEGVESRIHTALTSQISQARPVLQRGRRRFLPRPNPFDLAILDERVGDLAEGGFDGLLILRQRQSPSRCGGRPKASNLTYQNCKICLTL